MIPPPLRLACCLDCCFWPPWSGTVYGAVRNAHAAQHHQNQNQSLTRECLVVTRRGLEFIGGGGGREGFPERTARGDKMVRRA